MNFLVSLFAICFTIAFIVGFHEFGHFMTARLLGIKVVRFSIGFGKSLWKYRDKKGTEYAVAAIPLGGYVKMLDESEGKVAAEELRFTFNRQPLYKKLLVVLAGPFFNFMLAVVLYWLLFVVGFTTIAPVIGQVTPHSIAAMAGVKPQEEIVRIQDRETNNWTSVIFHLLGNVGDNAPILITTQPRGTTLSKYYLLDLTHWQLDKLKPNPLQSLGIVPYEPEIPSIIGILQSDSPAAKSALQVGDKILAINNSAMKNWRQVIDAIAAHPREKLEFKIERKGRVLTVPVEVGVKRSGFSKEQGYLGVAPDFKFPRDLLQHNKYSPLRAFYRAGVEVTDLIRLNVIMLEKMATGKVSLQSLGGPITIFEGAGNSLNSGILPFLEFIAFMSIAIGVINMLPIPGLDGGHILIYLIECGMRRPMAARTQELIFRLGLIALMVLVVQAIANDLMRI